MKSIYKKHVFVCENVRESKTRKSCGNQGKKIRARLKKIVFDKGLNTNIRINRSGCLDQCENGPCLVVYPEGIWYTKINKNDCMDIFLKSIINKE